MKKIFLTVALCLGVAGLYAQTGSIERVLKSIEQNNRELRAGEEAVRAEKLEVRNENNLEDPSVSYSRKFGEEDGIGDCDETDWETYFSINSSTAYIPQDQVEQFREYLQYFYEFALSHQAEFGFEGNFIPSSQEAFARLTFLEEDGKIMPKAMRY